MKTTKTPTSEDFDQYLSRHDADEHRIRASEQHADDGPYEGELEQADFERMLEEWEEDDETL